MRFCLWAVNSATFTVSAWSLVNIGILLTWVDSRDFYIGVEISILANCQRILELLSIIILLSSYNTSLSDYGLLPCYTGCITVKICRIFFAIQTALLVADLINFLVPFFTSRIKATPSLQCQCLDLVVHSFHYFCQYLSPLCMTCLAYKFGEWAY